MRTVRHTLKKTVLEEWQKYFCICIHFIFLRGISEFNCHIPFLILTEIRHRQGRTDRQAARGTSWISRDVQALLKLFVPFWSFPFFCTVWRDFRKFSCLLNFLHFAIDPVFWPSSKYLFVTLFYCCPKYKYRLLSLNTSALYNVLHFMALFILTAVLRCVEHNVSAQTQFLKS